MNKTVLITGASRGIGKAIAERFAKSGYKLAINSRNKDEIESVKKELGTYTPVFSFAGDVGDYTFAKDFIDNTINTFGTVDVLINNAGISYVGLFSEMGFEDWNRIITTNLTSVFNLSSLIIPHMLHKKCGNILNISSIWGNVGASMEVAYSASKGGINALTKALAKELAPSNINVNAIACGVINTSMNNFLSEDEMKALIGEIPASRLGEPSEVADLAYDICNLSYLTGQVITLDGGLI